MGFKHWLKNAGRHFKGPFESERAYHRSHIRNQCMIASEFGYSGNRESAMIKNLNGSGAYIETHRRFRVGEVVQLKFPLHYLDPPVEVTGVVAWTGTEGVGVKFQSSGS
jgi:Tfp pilus assembly protein PilZ